MKFSKEQYLQQAHQLVDKYEYEMALKFYTKAFEAEQDGEVAFLIANCYLELEQSIDSPMNQKNAVEWLLKSLELLNGKGWQQCLSLAQLHAEKESAEWYERGITELTDILENSSLIEDKRAELVRSTSNALCALTELYMTDCCEYPEAEANCVKYMSRALDLDPKNPEVYSTYASVLLSQCKPDEARIFLENGMDLWYQEPEEGRAVVIDPSWPQFLPRLALAKLLIEVESFERAMAILETCQAENDSDCEIWYLFAWCYSCLSKGAEDSEEKESLNQDAKECLEKILSLDESFRNTGEGEVPEDILEHAVEMLKDIDHGNMDIDMVK